MNRFPGRATTLQDPKAGAGLWALRESVSSGDNISLTGRDRDAQLVLFDAAVGISDMFWYTPVWSVTGEHDLYSSFLDPTKPRGLNNPSRMKALDDRVIAIGGSGRNTPIYKIGGTLILSAGFTIENDGMVPALSALGDMSSVKTSSPADPADSSFGETRAWGTEVHEDSDHSDLRLDGPGGSWDDVIAHIEDRFPVSLPTTPEIEISRPATGTRFQTQQVTVSGTASGVDTVHLWVDTGSWAYHGSAGVNQTGTWSKTLSIGVSAVITTPLSAKVRASNSATSSTGTLHSSVISVTREATSSGDLAVTVYGTDGTTAVKGATVELFSVTWKNLGKPATTNASGVASWSDLPVGIYNYRVYSWHVPDGLPASYEFWGQDTIAELFSLMRRFHSLAVVATGSSSVPSRYRVSKSSVSSTI